MIKTHKLTLETQGTFAIVNVTDTVLDLVSSSGIREGSALVFYRHTTGTVFLTEYEAGIIADLEDVLDGIAPSDGDYRHHLRAVDFNAHAHMRNVILGTNVMIPISGGELMLGRYQQILVLDMQTERAPRSLVVQISGEA